MNDRDYTIEDTYRVRFEKLNGLSYKEYLKSNHWIELKNKAKKRKLYKKCNICGCSNIELHHKNYKWILTKYELRSIIALCREHHQEIHNLSKELNVSVRVATNKTLSNYNIAH